jgi:hypothetical protein
MREFEGAASMLNTVGLYDATNRIGLTDDLHSTIGTGIAIVGSQFKSILSSKIKESVMLTILALTTLPFAAIGYSILYLLLGGGFFGAFLIFVVAKILGR